VSAVRLTDGSAAPCDAVLVGVGAAPNDALAREAGLDCADGIIVDANARTSDPSIHAIGDCTRRPLPLYQRTGRLESAPNALEQAKQAAADLCGRAPPSPEVPWFWSDQYDTRLQIAGLPFDVEETAIRGDPAAGSFAIFHLTQDGTVQAVEAVNAPTDFGSIAIRRVMLAAPTRRIGAGSIRGEVEPLGVHFRRSTGEHPLAFPDAKADAFVAGLDQQVWVKHSLVELQLAEDQSRSRQLASKLAGGYGDRFRNRQFAQEISRYPAFFPMCSSPQLDQSGSGDQCNQAHPDEAAGNCQRT
jgi:hypothetical protein